MKGVSVIICCFNSEKRLPKTLDYLLQQDVQGVISWQVIIVDNGSLDRTMEVAGSYAASFQHVAPLQIIREPNPGLTNARQTGIKAAMYDFVLFCDDDNWLSENYVRKAYDLLNENSNLGACGGYGIAVCEVTPPAWFHFFERPYAVGKPQAKPGILTEPHAFLTGAGMCIRKEAWMQIEASGFRPILSDRKGKELTSGGDLEICYLLRLTGFQLYYSDQICYSHFIPAERLTRDYLTRLHTGIGKANVMLTCYEYLLNNLSIDKGFIWLRILLKITPKTIKFLSGKTNDIVYRMEKVAALSYYTELLKRRSDFDANLKMLKRLSEPVAPHTNAAGSAIIP
jgi:glycosyltransferase involved in cell wall biosynthesis